MATVPYFGNANYTQLLTKFNNDGNCDIFAYLLGFSPSYEIDINGLPVNVYSSFGSNGEVDAITGDGESVLFRMKQLTENAFLNLPNER